MQVGHKLKWPILFERFIDDGFGILEFNLLQETITIDKFKFGNEVNLWTCLYTKEKNYIYPGSYTFLFSKKKKTNICTFRI